MSPTPSRPLVIGLTGGIGSGKTAAAEYFAARGVPVFDADLLARDLVQPGEPALRAITERFGPEVLTADGQLDRPRLRRWVFADSLARKDLDGILHPRIRQRMEALIDTCDARYCIAAIPLLFEADQRDIVDRVLVVDVPESLQLHRVMLRDDNTEDQARAALRSQTSRKRRLELADFVIRNDGDLQALDEQVERLHECFVQIARDRHPPSTDTPLPAPPK